MMKRIIYILAIIGVVTARADLVWTPETGWSAEGGILEQYFGKNLDANSAIEAMNFAREEQEKGNHRAALNMYSHVYTRYVHSILAPEALYQSGLIRMERCEYTEAFTTFQKIITDYPGYPKFNDVIEVQFEIASMLQKGKRPYYWGIIPGFRDYNGAIEFFESIVTNAPYNYYAPMALMNIADLAVEHKEVEDAIDALDRLISDYPDSELVPDAYLKLADLYLRLVKGPEYDQGTTLEAIRHYEDFLYLYPNHPDVERAEDGLACAKDIMARNKLVMGDFYYKYRNNCRAARIYYSETITVAPMSPAADTARDRLELIEEGILAPKTVVDYFLGRYKMSREPAYLEEVEKCRGEPKEIRLEPLKDLFEEDVDDIESGAERVEPYAEESDMPFEDTMESMDVMEDEVVFAEEEPVVFEEEMEQAERYLSEDSFEEKSFLVEEEEEAVLEGVAEEAAPLDVDCPMVPEEAQAECEPAKDLLEMGSTVKKRRGPQG